MQTGTAFAAMRRLPRRPGPWNWGEDARGRSSWERGRVLAAVAVVLAALLALHRAVPNALGHLGSLHETFLPWLGLAIPVLAALTLLRRSITGLLALALPLAAWLGIFGGLLLPPADSGYNLTAVQHNVSDVNPDPAATAMALMKVQPDLIALEELTSPALETYAATLSPAYPYHAVRGTVGLWSRYPLTATRAVDIKPEEIVADWSRGLRASVRTPRGEVAVYVAHLPSLRLGLRSGFNSAWRDESATRLGAAIAAEQLDQVILLGDLNSTVNDRGLGPVSSQLSSPGPGFALSWPAAVPVARIDQIMARSARVTHVWSLPATGSDHLPIAARIRL